MKFYNNVICQPTQVTTQSVSVVIDMTIQHEENDGATYSDSQAQNVLQSRNNITTDVTRSESLVTGTTQRTAEDPQTTAEPDVEAADTSTEPSNQMMKFLQYLFQRPLRMPP